MNRGIYFRALLWALLTVSLVMNCGCSDSRYGAERLYWKAEQAAASIMKEKSDSLTAEDYQQLIAEYCKVISAYPLEPLAAQAHFKISEIYITQKKFEDAQSEMKTMIRNFSSNSSLAARGQFAIGKIHEIRGNTIQALAEYDKVSEMYPLTLLGIQMPLYTVQYLARIGKSEEQAKIYDKAVKKYDRLLNDYSGTSVAPMILTVKAQLNVLMKKNDEVLRAWNDLILEYPQSPEAINACLSKADFYERQLKDIPTAIGIYTKFISDYAGQAFVPDAEVRLAWLYARSGDSEKAQVLFEKLAQNKKNPENVRLSALLGLAAMARNSGQKAETLRLYDYIQTNFSSTRIGVAVPFLKAQYLFETDDVRAETALAEAIDRYNALTDDLAASREIRRTAAHYLTLAYIRNNEHQKALQTLQALVAEYPDNPGYLLDIAGVYTIMKEQDKAIDVYEKLIEKYTGNEYLVSLSKAKIRSLESMSLPPTEGDPVQ